MKHEKIEITYEDYRYPLVTVVDENATTHGYSVNLRDGSLTKVCICHASCSGECVCGYDCDKCEDDDNESDR